jgi:hypothetical protein
MEECKMTQNNNNNNNQNPNYNESQYNKNYYSPTEQNTNQNSYYANESAFNQTDYVPQSYGMGNRYDDLYDYEEEAGSKDFIIGALVGGIIGAAAGFFGAHNWVM